MCINHRQSVQYWRRIWGYGIITVGHDVPEVDGSPICRSYSEIYGGGAAVPYEGDVSDSDCESVEDRERYLGGLVWLCFLKWIRWVSTRY